MPRFEQGPEETQSYSLHPQLSLTADKTAGIFEIFKLKKRNIVKGHPDIDHPSTTPAARPYKPNPNFIYERSPEQEARDRRNDESDAANRKFVPIADVRAKVHTDLNAAYAFVNGFPFTDRVSIKDRRLESELVNAIINIAKTSPDRVREFIKS
jgi:hypothetical protein